MSHPLFHRNLFEIENARNLTRDEVVQTFVPTETFWRMLSAKNHVLLGSRGSGKTALAKMLSHDHLSRLPEQKVMDAVAAKAFIGLYVPTRLEWVGGLRNKPWQTESEKEHYFRWRLNIATCLSFLVAAESCLQFYESDESARIRSERSLCQSLSAAWAYDKRIDSIAGLRQYLETVEHQKQIQLARQCAGLTRPEDQPIGVDFDIDLFAPLRRAMTAATEIFSLPENTAWLLCLDEAEFLDNDHQRILNSHMRAHSGNLFFKLTTVPYSHHLETTTPMPVDPGHDFEYVYLDRDPVFLERTRYERGRIGTSFARKLFSKRAAVSGEQFARVTVHDLLGNSEILDPRPEDWKPDSPNMKLLAQYASPETIDRATKMQGKPEFMSQIGRKLHGALILRHKVASLKGRTSLDVYSGATMAMRCGDSNPRRLIRIFNAMLLAARWRTSVEGTFNDRPIEPDKQTQILVRLSDDILSATQSEPQVGAELFHLITMIGEYMRHSLHEMPITTDQISSIWIDDKIPQSEWRLIARAVALGLLYPSVNQNNPDELPVKQGTFHLSYALAPHFRILPRRGKARSLSTIERFARTGEEDAEDTAADEAQMKLQFDQEDSDL